MTFAPRILFGIGLSLVGLVGASVPLSAQPSTALNTGIPYDFERPTFEKQPLPNALNTAQAWETIGQNAFVAEDYRNSLSAYNKAVQLARPGDRPELLEERGWVHYRLGQYQRAEEDLDRAAMLYWQQSEFTQYLNVKQMQLFVEAQAGNLDTLS